LINFLFILKFSHHIFPFRWFSVVCHCVHWIFILENIRNTKKLIFQVFFPIIQTLNQTA
jgi:hypothetical protein